MVCDENAVSLNTISSVIRFKVKSAQSELITTIIYWSLIYIEMSSIFYDAMYIDFIS